MPADIVLYIFTITLTEEKKKERERCMQFISKVRPALSPLFQDGRGGKYTRLILIPYINGGEGGKRLVCSLEPQVLLQVGAAEGREERVPFPAKLPAPSNPAGGKRGRGEV